MCGPLGLASFTQLVFRVHPHGSESNWEIISPVPQSVGTWVVSIVL